MTFEFHAGCVWSDKLCRRLSFLDRDDNSSEHYFVMDRSEDSPEQPVPDMENVYIERDDQGFGGYGGITHVVLARDSLTLRLGARMTSQMGGNDTLRIGFTLSDPDFRSLQQVLELIMCGYESCLETVL